GGRRERGESGVRPRHGRADDESEPRPLPRRDACGIALAHLRHDPGRHGGAVLQPRPLRGEGLRIAGGGEDEHALPMGFREVERGRERSDPEEGVRGDRVGFQGRAGGQPRVGIGVHRGAGVAAPGVGDDHQPGGAAGGEHILQRGDPAGSVPLEERHLGLDDAHRAGGRLDHPQAELACAGGGGIQSPLLQQRRVRVDAHAQRPARLQRGTHALAEGGHARSPTDSRACSGAPRRRAYSCRLLTAKPSRRIGRALTAAPRTAMVVNSALSPATAAARISYPSARAMPPLGVFTTMSTSPRLMRSTMLSSPLRCVAENLFTSDTSMPLRERISAVPSVARSSKPCSASRCAGRITARLSLSATEMNTVPAVGRPPYAADWLLANAVGKSRSIPMTSPVERISGPSTESTVAPAAVRNRLNGSTASLTATGASNGGREPSSAGSSPSAFSSAMLAPAMMREAALARGMPSAFETNGTVRLARGMASMT